MNEFRTFIASSLKNKFLKLRECFDSAIKSLSDDEELPFSFNAVYRFENSDTNTARYKGIQGDINRRIGDYHAFVLICDDNIGVKTVEEFNQALDLFLHAKTPAFITILKERGSGNTPPSAGQISFETFINEYLTKYSYDAKTGKIDDDRFIYPYEFGDVDAAAEKLKKDLKTWIIESEYRPLFDAIQGKDYQPENLYDDQDRLSKCDKKRYFHRNFDDELYNAMSQGGGNNTILLKGASLSGKTRALYQAIKSFPDAWFYKFPSNPSKIVEKIENVIGFLNVSKSRMQQFLIFDDIHYQASESKEHCDKLTKAIVQLRRSLGENTKIIATTTEDCDLLGDCTEISIKQMSDKECNEAKLFCYRQGVAYSSGYKTIGAMLIDLDSLRGDYNKYLDECKDKYEKRMRRCLLWGIKASSVWHSTSIGDVRKLCEITKAFYLSKFKDATDVDGLLYAAIDKLLVLRGISNNNPDATFELDWEQLPKFIQIEEYIYKYILGFEGKVLQSGEPASLEDERKTLTKILDYVCSSNEEAVVTCLSKLARRAEHRNEISEDIFNLVMGCYTDSFDAYLLGRWSGNQNEGWYAKLKEEIGAIKAEVAANSDLINENASEESQYFAKVVWTKMLTIETFEEAKEVFERVPSPLQSLPMLASLVVKCRTKRTSVEEAERNIKTLMGMPQYQRDESCKSFYIIAKVIPLCGDFQSAYDIFNNGKLPFEDAKEYLSLSLNRAVDEHDLYLKNFEREWLAKAINALAAFVKNSTDLEKFLQKIRNSYVFLIDDIDLVKRFVESEDIYNLKNLTMIDLLSRLNIYGLRSIFMNFADWSEGRIPEEVIMFITNVLRPDLETTLQQCKKIEEYHRISNHERVADASCIYTQRYAAKQTAINILNVFLECANECKYSEVLNELFAEMYANNGKRTIPLRDSFSYARMLENKNCRYLDGIELYNKYILPHSKDKDEHFSITYILLNRMIKLAYTENEYRRVSKLYDEHNTGKDIYTYNNALKHLPYEVCVGEILPEMIENGCELDVYTLGEVVAKALSVKVAVGYFYPSLRIMGVAANDKGVKGEKCRKAVDAMVRKYTDTENFPLINQHYLWAQLFTVKCSNNEDRSILHKMLAYLEQQASETNGELFADGIIYNNCLKNTSFICNYNEAKDFLEKRNLRVDKYTLSHLINHIILEYKGNRHARKYAEEAFNGLYIKYKDVVCKELKCGNTHIYNNRINIYASFLDKYSFVFIQPDGTEEVLENASPIDYLNYLVEKGLPIDKHTLAVCLKNPDKSYSVLKALLHIVESKNIHLDVHAIRGLADTFYKVIPQEDKIKVLSRIYKLPFFDDRFAVGQLVVHAFTSGYYDLETAFDAVDGNDVEKLYAYTQLYGRYRKKEYKRLNGCVPQEVKVEMFNKSWDLYKRYVKDRLTPNNSIFSSILNFASTEKEMDLIFNEMERLQIAPAEFVITPIMNCTRSIEEADSWISRYKNLGGRFSISELDAILKGVYLWWHKTQNSDVAQYLDAFIRFLLREKEAQNTLPSELGCKFPYFSQYAESALGVSSHTLDILLGYGNDADIYIQRMRNLLDRYYKPAFNLNMLYVYNRSKKLGLTDAQMLEELSPYPQLVFGYAVHMKQCSIESYGKLIDLWGTHGNLISNNDVLDALAQILNKGCSEEMMSDRCKILDNLCYKWYDEVRIADFLPDSCGDDKYAMVVEELYVNRNLNDLIITERMSRAIDVGEELVKAYKNKLLSNEVLKSLSSPQCCRYTFESLKGLISLMVASADKKGVAIVLKTLVSRLRKVEDLEYFLTIIQNGNLAADNISSDVVMDAVYTVIWQDRGLMTAFLRYKKEKGTFENWYPDADFLQQVFGVNPSTAKRVEGSVARLFSADWSVKVNNFADSLDLYFGLPHRNATLAKEVMLQYVAKNFEKLKIDGQLANGEFVAAYIKSAWLQDKLLTSILCNGVYNTDVLLGENMPSGLFGEKMTSAVFRVLSYRLSILKDRTFNGEKPSSIKLLYNLLQICGVDFVYADLTLLDEIARSIQSIDEYRLFVQILRDNNLPVKPSLTESLVYKLSGLSYNNTKNKLLMAVGGRVRALAELSSYYNNKKSADFKAGYLILAKEEDLDFTNWFWGNQVLYLDDGEYLKKLQNRESRRKIFDISKLESIGLRFITVLKLYENSAEFQKWSWSHGVEDMRCLLRDFVEALKLRGENVVPFKYVRRIVDLWVKLDYIKYYNYVVSKFHKHEEQMIPTYEMFYTLIAYYRNLYTANLIHDYYKDAVLRNLQIVKKLCYKSKSPDVKIHFRVFQINKDKNYNGYVKVRIKELLSLLEDIPDVLESDCDYRPGVAKQRKI